MIVQQIYQNSIHIKIKLLTFSLYNTVSEGYEFVQSIKSIDLLNKHTHIHI